MIAHGMKELDFGRAGALLEARELLSVRIVDLRSVGLVLYQAGGSFTTHVKVLTLNSPLLDVLRRRCALDLEAWPSFFFTRLMI